MSNSTKKESTLIYEFKKNILLILGLIISLPAILFYLFQFYVINFPNKESDYLDYFSKLGDSIGGFSGPLLSFSSILLVLHTIKIQRIELNQQKKELLYQRKEYIENKIFTIIYKEYDRWKQLSDGKKSDLKTIVKPYLSTINTFVPEIVQENINEIKKNNNLELIEEFNRICFRLYALIFDDSGDDSEKLTTMMDKKEIRNILYVIGSLFYTTKIYAIYDCLLCENLNKNLNIKEKAYNTLIIEKMNYIKIICNLTFEYQISNLNKQKIYDFANEKLFTFFQVNRIQNKISILKEHQNPSPD